VPVAAGPSRAALGLIGAALLAPFADAGRAPIPTIARDPYVGAIVVDADSGRVLFEDGPDATCFPASTVKLMDLLLVLEDVARGAVQLADTIKVTAEAERMGGSQVYLREHETFTVDDLLYALSVQSANDAAVALAVGISGSKSAFVERMNRRARELGMHGTQFHSVHGLPPSAGQQVDRSTPRDLARLGRAVLAHADALRYTSTVRRGFRGGSFMLESHNNLLGRGGCDGLKTGYIRAGGFSIVATAERSGRRVIAVVACSATERARDRAAAHLLDRGLGVPTPARTATAAGR
jgi:D-alanyl-D-alanine carboxypeptidase (penicillin-binding protein 5/6)